MHLSSYTWQAIGDYHAQHPFVDYTLHDRAGTLASLLYKAEKPSVRPSVCLTVSPVTQLCLHGSTWNLQNTIAMSSSMCKFVSKRLLAL